MMFSAVAAVRRVASHGAGARWRHAAGGAGSSALAVGSNKVSLCGISDDGARSRRAVHVPYPTVPYLNTTRRWAGSVEGDDREQRGSTRSRDVNSNVGSKQLVFPGAGLTAMPLLGAASTSEPLLGPTAVWLLESCVGIGSIKLGLPGVAAQFFFASPIPTFREVIAKGFVISAVPRHAMPSPGSYRRVPSMSLL
eukprot:m.206973 g.206973  ORF g.206973 m.206973 type:complete len:195 (+) comp25376_c0_seq1:85-669(+)